MRVFSVIFASTLLLLGAGQSAANARRCEYSEPRTLQLDYTGVRRVAFISSGGNHQLHITGTANPDRSITARACASSADALKQLALRQERQGERLLVTLEHPKRLWHWLGRHDTYLVFDAGIPDDIPVKIDIGAGNVQMTGIAALSGAVAAGDLDVRAIAGEVAIRRIGAGNAEFTDIGSLRIDRIGAGNVEIKHVRGAVAIDSIGAGNLELDDAGGDVSIGSIGAGNVEIKQVRGNVSIDSLGVGNIEVKDVSGDLNMQSKGIGSIEHQRIGGTVKLP